MPANIEQELHGMHGELTDFLNNAKEEVKEQGARLHAVEQALSKSHLANLEMGETKSLGEIVTGAEQCKTFLHDRLPRSGKVSIGGSFFSTKTAIVSDGSLFTQPYRVPQISAVTQRLTIRDLLRTSPTQSNLVEYVKEISSTNAAAPQGKGSSPQVFENVAKAESALGFQLFSEAVVTLAHWIPASKQVLDDAPSLAAFINARLIYFLKLKEEDQLLNGLGSGGDLNGLLTQATPAEAGQTGDSAVEQIRMALAQVAVAGFSPNCIALHPRDWAVIELTKASGSGEYLVSGNPRAAGPATLWGVNVVPTMAMDEGTFLVADLANCAELFDRMQSSVEISREHASMFVENMCAILAEERLCLVVYQPTGIVSGTLIGVSP